MSTQDIWIDLNVTPLELRKNERFQSSLF